MAGLTTPTVPFACEPTCSHTPDNVSIKASVYDIDFQMHAEARGRVLEAFRGDGSVPGKSALLFQGGNTETRDETDTEKLFRQESTFNYLFGVKEPDCYAVIDVDSGESTLFIPRLPEEYEIWMGKIKPPEWYKGQYGVSKVLFVDEMKQAIESSASQLYTSYGYNTDSGNYATPATYDGIDAAFPGEKNNKEMLYRVVVECRVIKSEKELSLLRYINDIASDSHLETMRRARPEMYEFQLESMFKHYCYFAGGCRMDAYTAICGCGCNSATLHYGHAAAPNSSLVKDGDMCLLDMGTEFHCYTSDITCSFPANGKFTEDQKAIFETVQDCQEQVMAAMRPGVAWIDMHTLTYRIICEHMVKIGILKGDVGTLMEKNLAGYFMPHGLGHFLGLDTHDVGGIPADKVDSRPKDLGYKSLRCLRVLKAGMVITVEPGVYFVDLLVRRLKTDPNLSVHVNADVLDRFVGFGGVRLEDDVIVTKDGVENMTNCPRTVEDVENVMNGTIKSRAELKPLFYRK